MFLYNTALAPDSLVDGKPLEVRLAFCGRLAGDESSGRAWLTPEEERRWKALACEKRRADWLSGRVAAKRALMPELAALDVEVLNENSGRPFLRRLDGGPAAQISISHCAEGAVCAVSINGGPVGVDVETVAPRAERVVELYAHDSERRAGLACDARKQTLLWTLKEAALKLLGLGLTCDPRDARLRSLEPDAELAFFGAARRRWEDLGRPAIRSAWRDWAWSAGSPCMLSWCWTSEVP